jgi:hypothetical protein
MMNFDRNDEISWKSWFLMDFNWIWWIWVEMMKMMIFMGFEEFHEMWNCEVVKFDEIVIFSEKWWFYGKSWFLMKLLKMVNFDENDEFWWKCVEVINFSGFSWNSMNLKKLRKCGNLMIFDENNGFWWILVDFGGNHENDENWAILVNFIFRGGFVKNACVPNSNRIITFASGLVKPRLFQSGGSLVRRRRYIIMQNERFAVYSRMWMAQANSDEGSLWEGVASNMRHVNHGGDPWWQCWRNWVDRLFEIPKWSALDMRICLWADSSSVWQNGEFAT